MAALTDVLIIGGGACGALHGMLMVSANTRVSVICRSNYSAVYERGYKVVGSDGERRFMPHMVFRDVDDALASGIAFTHIAVFTKTTTDCVPLLLRLAKPGATRTVSLFQNGLKIEHRVRQALPESIAIVSVVMYCGVALEGDGSIVRTTSVQRCVMGGFEVVTAESRAAVDELVALCLNGGMHVEHYQDIQVVRWHKCLWNATFGLVSFVSDGADNAMMLSSEAACTLIRSLMHEVAAAAEKSLGKPIPFDKIGTMDDLFRTTKKTGTYKASVVRDWEAGNDVESDTLWKNVLDEGMRCGVPMPRLEALFTCAMLKISARRNATRSVL